MKNGPAFQFYAADFLIGTAMMSNEETGVYIRLLCYEWEYLKLPAEIQALCKLSAADEKVVRRVLDKFTLIDGAFVNQKLEQVRQEQLEYRLQQQKNSLKRWTKKVARRRNKTALCDGIPTDGPNSMPNASPSSSSSSSSPSLPATPEAPPVSPPRGTPPQPQKLEQKTGNGKLTPLSDLWNQVCVSLPKVLQMTPERRTKERLRLKELPLEQWKTVFEKLEASTFCRGSESQNGKKAWKATFEWIIRNSDNAIKTLEGKYDDTREAKRRQGISADEYFAAQSAKAHD